MTVCRFSLLLAIALSLLACKPTGSDRSTTSPDAVPTPPPSASTHRAATAATRWQCDKLAVTTHFDDESLESITLETPERMLTLKSMANEDGARFADAAGNEFWSRPGKVSLTLVGQSTVDCLKLRDAAAAR